MQYRVLGKTGLRVSALGFGGSSLGGVFGNIDEQEGIRSVHVALDHGINLIDTAPYYGKTTAETVLGKALRDINRDRYLLATKVARFGPNVEDFDFSAARVFSSVDESLQRLGVEHIDFLQVHDMEFGNVRQIIEETLPALRKVQAAGKARFVGITGLHMHIFRLVMEEVEVDQVQSYCHYCLNDTALADYLPYFEKKGVGIFNSAPIAMRLLSDDNANLPAWHPAPLELHKKCVEASEFCRKRGQSLARLALQFAVANTHIHTHIVGSASPARVIQNIQDAAVAPDPELLAGVLEILKPVHNMTWASGLPENQPPS